MKKIASIVLFAGLACANTLTVLTHDSWNMDKALVGQFETENNVKVEFIKGGDAVQTTNKAILTKNAPIADVLYGFDNATLTKVLKEGLLVRHGIKNSAFFTHTVLDKSGYALPVDYGYVALNLDKAAFASKPRPKRFSDLTKPEFASQLVVENPTTSSPGMLFLLSTVAAFGENGYLNFWQNARDNGLMVAGGWSDAYYTHFSRYGGKRSMVVSYASSPAAELFYSEEKPAPTIPPTDNLFLPKSSYMQVEFAGVLKGSKNQDMAKRFLQWMVSKPVQEAIPTQMWVYPTLKSAQLPEVFKFAQRPKQAANLSAKTVNANLERWLSEWTKVMVQNQNADTVESQR